MTVKLDVLGYRYDDVEPAFTDTGQGFYLHWRSHKMYDKKSFDAWMVSKSLSFGAKEVGKPSALFLANHSWGGLAAGAPSPPVVTLAPITATVTKVPSNAADDTGAVTVAGGPADKAYTVTLTIHGQGSPGDDVQNVPVAKGATAEQVAAALAVASSDPNVTAAASGKVVTFTPSAGTHMTKLTVSVS